MYELFKKTFSNFLSNLAVFVSGFLISILIARYLGPTETGKYSYLIWLSSVITLALTLGLPLTITRFVAKYEAAKQKMLINGLISGTFLFEGIVSIILIIFFVAGYLFIGFGDEKINYLLIVLSIPPLLLTSILTSFLQGLQKYTVIFKINSIVTSFNLLLVLIAVLLKLPLLALITISLIVALFNLLICFFYIINKNYLSNNVTKIPKQNSQEIYNYLGIVSTIVFLDFIVWQKSEIFFLKHFSNLNEIGYYSLAYSLVSKVMAVIPSAISGVVMPNIAKHFEKNNKYALSAIYYESTRYLLFIVFPIIFVGYIVIDSLVPMLVGASYLPAIPVIKILLVSGGLGAIATTSAAVVYGIGKQKFILIVGLVIAILNVLLDIVLIPKMGAIGAAIANGVAQLLGVAIGIYYILYVRKLHFPFIAAVKVLLACGLTMLLIDLIKSYLSFLPKNFFAIQGIIFGSIYLIILYFMHFFNAQDLIIIKKTLKLITKRGS